MGALSGSRVKLLYNGQEAGWATGVNGASDHEVFLVDVLGNIDVEEIEPTGRKHRFTASFVGLKGVSFETLSLKPKSGNNPATATRNAVLFPALSGQLWDDVLDEAVESWEGIRLTSDDFSVQKGGVLLRNASFVMTRRVDHNDGA